MEPQNTNSQPFQSQLDSVYYVHRRDKPDLVLIMPKLDGSNYVGWNISMCHALRSKKKRSIIDHQCQFLPYLSRYLSS